MDVTSFEVRQLIGEYDFVAKQLYQVKGEKKWRTQDRTTA